MAFANLCGCDNVIVDDIRFLNEVETLGDCILIYVERNVEGVGTHASEASQEVLKSMATHVVYNNGSMDDLHLALKELDLERRVASARGIRLRG